MATLINRRMFWVAGSQVIPCVIVGHDLSTAMCDIAVGQERYTVDAYALYANEGAAARAVEKNRHRQSVAGESFVERR